MVKKDSTQLFQVDAFELYQERQVKNGNNPPFLAGACSCNDIRRQVINVYDRAENNPKELLDNMLNNSLADYYF